MGPGYIGMLVGCALMGEHGTDSSAAALFRAEGFCRWTDTPEECGPGRRNKRVVWLDEGADGYGRWAYDEIPTHRQAERLSARRSIAQSLNDYRVDGVADGPVSVLKEAKEA